MRDIPGLFVVLALFAGLGMKDVIVALGGQAAGPVALAAAVLVLGLGAMLRAAD